MKKILVTDDDKIKRLKLIRFLRTNGYQVDEAKNGPETITLLKKSPYDLLIIDNIMPKLTGLDTCKFIKENKVNPALKIIIFIGFGSLADYPEIKELGIDKGLVKPINQSELMQAIHQLIPQ